MPNICEEYIKKWPTIKSPDKDDNPKHLVDSRVCLYPVQARPLG